jgi:hypothetical protein
MIKLTGVETETKTKLGTTTKISLGFMLATGIITVGLFALAGLYALIVNHYGRPGVLNLSNAPAPITGNLNKNTNTNSNANTDLNFSTD